LYEGLTKDGAAIRTTGLTKKYDSGFTLNPLDLVVEQNAIVGFLGPNGSGKTTTIKLLLGLIKPTSGKGTVLGCDIQKESLTLRSKVGYMSQESRFYSFMSVMETLRFVASIYYRDHKSKKINALIDEKLKLVGLSQKTDRKVGELSGGERQRLGFAQALLNNPQLLVLDEPAASLDPLGRREILDLVESLRGDTTIFFSTHILDDVQKVCDSIIILKDGNCLANGPIDTVLGGGQASKYILVLESYNADITKKLKEQPWISGIDIRHGKVGVEYLINSNNPRELEKRILRFVLDDDSVTVIEFKREEHTLEDAFMRLVGENS
jgi:ABC-2 type transport system ATP-binding protein